MTDREKLAMAMAKSAKWQPDDEWIVWLLRELRAAGLAVVPREATDRMVLAYFTGDPTDACRDWTAMLAVGEVK